jgi:hypothetical protein
VVIFRVGGSGYKDIEMVEEDEIEWNGCNVQSQTLQSSNKDPKDLAWLLFEKDIEKGYKNVFGEYWTAVGYASVRLD